MKKYRKVISVAGIRMAVESERIFRFSDRCAAFEVEPGEADATFFLQWDVKPPMDGELICNSSEYQFLRKDGWIYRIRRQNPHMEDIAWYLRRISSDPVCYEIGICHHEDDEIYTINPFLYVDLASFLIQFDAAVLHSSLIRFRNRAIVFSAPSQTGKSTQAEIWEKYYGAEILNGDRSVIRRLENTWVAAGSPYAGSSRIYRNESAAIAAIVVLRQGKKNEIRRLRGKEAYLCLLSELSVSPVDREAVEQQSLWLLELLNQVPVYQLSCLPDRGAADLLYDVLEDRIDGTE